MENGWTWNIWSYPTTVSRTTALFAANGRCCTTMQVSVKIETEETASSDARMNDDGCVISEGFRGFGLMYHQDWSGLDSPGHSTVTVSGNSVKSVSAAVAELDFDYQTVEASIAARFDEVFWNIFWHSFCTRLKNTVPSSCLMSYFALQQFFGSPKNSDRRTYDTKMSAILPVTKVKPAAMARWLRAKPGSWILLSICRPQGGTKKTGCIILYFKMKHWSKERQNKNQDSSDIWCLVPVLLEGNPFRQDEEVEQGEDRNRTKRKETAGRQQLQNQQPNGRQPRCQSIMTVGKPVLVTRADTSHLQFVCLFQIGLVSYLRVLNK